MAPTIKAVKTLVLSSGMTLHVVSGHPAAGLKTEKIDVSDLTNATRLEYLCRPQLEETDLKFLCAYNGALASVGASGTLTITVTDTAGGTLTESLAGFVISAEPVMVDVGGERKLVQEVVFAPDGANTAITTTV
jgi:hypothetical protein